MKFFISPEQINGNIIIIKGEDVKHIRTVLRAQTGDTLTLCDRQNTDYICEIISLSPEEVKVKIIDSIICNTEPEVKVTLFQGIPKGSKMETVIQKCVELGVYKIVPVITERIIPKISETDSKKVERWQKISEAAAKQSGRSIIPEIGNILTFKDAVLECQSLGGAIIPYEKETKVTLKDFISTFNGTSLGVIIGPEGGFTQKEIKAAENGGITAITLGKRILRTETAGMASIAIILYELG